MSVSALEQQQSQPKDSLTGSLFHLSPVDIKNLPLDRDVSAEPLFGLKSNFLGSSVSYEPGPASIWRNVKALMEFSNQHLIPQLNAVRYSGVTDFAANQSEMNSANALNIFSDIVNTFAASKLEQTYVFEARREVTSFIAEYRLRGLLAAAAEPLNRAFGDTSIKTLRLLTDPEGFQTLFCVVLTDASVVVACQALETFDEEWWISHTGEAAGRLNFDFDFV